MYTIRLPHELTEVKRKFTLLSVTATFISTYPRYNSARSAIYKVSTLVAIFPKGISFTEVRIGLAVLC